MGVHYGQATNGTLNYGDSVVSVLRSKSAGDRIESLGGVYIVRRGVSGIRVT